jgi:tRNA threonylcarbamoyladenosine modification (KEOPS) complex  Pcc1 subunit
MKNEMSTSVYSKINLECNKELLKIIQKSLLPEIEQPTSNRATIKILNEKEKISILINASDLSALRAAINSYLRWINAIIDVVSIVE